MELNEMNYDELLEPVNSVDSTPVEEKPRQVESPILKKRSNIQSLKMKIILAKNKSLEIIFLDILENMELKIRQKLNMKTKTAKQKK